MAFNNNNNNNNNNNGPPATQQIEFQQAMQDFQTMFPEMESVVIEEVLRSNKGAVDATIDHLLSMTTDNLNESLRLDLERLEKESTKEESASRSSNYLNKPQSSVPNGESLKYSKKWRPPLLGPLPSDFLKIEPHNQRLIPDCGEDERIALFLQNEEFLTELIINKDFMNTLDQDVGEKSGSSGPDIEVFKERLRNMGKISRNKFAQLSKVFQRRKKNRSAKEILDQSASGDSMLLGAEPLLSESLDDTSIHKV